MANAGFSVGTFTGGGTFLVESLSGTLTPVGVVAWGGSGTATRVVPTAAGALPVTIYAGTLNAGTVSAAISGGTFNAGTVTVSTISAGTVAISTIAAGTVAVSTIAAGTVNVGGTALVQELVGTTSAKTNFTGTVDTQLLASNAARTGAWFANDADKSLYLGLGTAAVTTSSYSKLLLAGEFLGLSGYTGEVRGMMGTAVGSGAVRISEVTR